MLIFAALSTKLLVIRLHITNTNIFISVLLSFIFTIIFKKIQALFDDIRNMSRNGCIDVAVLSLYKVYDKAYLILEIQRFSGK